MARTKTYKKRKRTTKRPTKAQKRAWKAGGIRLKKLNKKRKKK